MNATAPTTAPLGALDVLADVLYDAWDDLRHTDDDDRTSAVFALYRAAQDGATIGDGTPHTLLAQVDLLADVLDDAWDKARHGSDDDRTDTISHLRHLADDYRDRVARAARAARPALAW